MVSTALGRKFQKKLFLLATITAKYAIIVELHMVGAYKVSSRGFNKSLEPRCNFGAMKLNLKSFNLN
jgi:hypothetical protein